MKRHFVLNQKIHNRVRSVMFITLAFLLGVLFPSPGHAQTKVKIFLLAGQSNMQGHANVDGLKNMLCAKDEIVLPDNPNGCYDSIASQEDRLFYTIGDFYGSHPTYDSVKARTEAQLISGYDLVDARLLFPFDQVQAINFNYSRSDTVRSGPKIWSGPLTTGFGYSNNGSSYGPELMFGHYMAQFIEDDIVLLKVAEGGTNLYMQWRSPSMEARLGPGDEPSNYPLLIQHLNEVRADIGNYISKYKGQEVETEIAGFVWFQGWNDAMSSVYAPEYEQNLTDLITDLRNDLGLPELPVVIGQTQNTGGNGLIVRAAQEAVGNSIGHAASVYTQDLSNYFHFDNASHVIIGARMGEAMKEILALQPITETIPNAPSGLNAKSQPVLSVYLTWTDNSNNEDAFWIERSTNPETGFNPIAIVPANTNSYLDPDVLHATTYYYRVRANNIAGYTLYSEVAFTTTDSLNNGFPLGWSNMDIDTPNIAGTTTYSDGLFTVIGNGSLNDTKDKFQFACMQLTGDGQIIARLNSMKEQAHWNNTGLMIRETLEPDSKYAMTLVNQNVRIRFKSRKDSISASTIDNVDTEVPVWLKLVRSGDVFTAYRSADGDTWEKTHEDTVEMNNDIYIGLASYSTHSGKSTTGNYSRVSVTPLSTSLMPPTALEVIDSTSNSITLSWTDITNNETGFKIERSLDSSSGFMLITSLSANTTSYSDNDLSPGTTYYYRIRTFNDYGISDYSEVISGTTDMLANELPDGWLNTDIGNPSIAGSTVYSDGLFTVIGNGFLNDTKDDFQFAYMQLTGDAQIVARLNSMKEKAHWNSTGLMVRESLEPDSKYAMTLVNQNEKIRFRSRKDSISASTIDNVNTEVPVWLKLVRTGDIFTAYRSADGDTWEKTYEDTVKMSNDIHIGIATFSRHPNKSTTGNYSEVSVIPLSTTLMPPAALEVIDSTSNSITLSWTDITNNETGFKIERSLDSSSGFTVIASVTANTTYLESSNLLPDTTYYFRIIAFNEADESDYSEVVSGTTDTLSNDLPDGWLNTDIGNPSIAGSTVYSDDLFTVIGNGSLSDTKDKFQYACMQLTGDGQIIARLNSMKEQAHWNNTGLMIRETLETDSRYAMTLVNQNERIRFKSRKDSISASTIDNVDTEVPVWLKLVRTGDIFTAYRSADGNTWEKTHEDTVEMNNDIYIGLASYSTHSGKSTTGNYSRVSVTLLPSSLMPPTALEATGNLDNGIELHWSDNSDNETGFVIERSADGETGFTEVATVAANTTYYQEYALTEGTYYYRVKAINQIGSSIYTETANAYTLQYDNMILYMPRLAGDYDKAYAQNGISITTSEDFENERFIHTGLKGRHLSINMEYPLLSSGGAVSLKVIPTNLNQEVDFFRSEDLIIRQVEDHISVVVDGNEVTSSAILDTIICNHVVLRIADQLAELYVNGQWVNIGSTPTFSMNTFDLGEYNGQLWDLRMFSRTISDEEVLQLSQRCLSDVEHETIPFADSPQCICGPYYCFWAAEDMNIRDEKYLYHLRWQQSVHEKYVFEAGMYDHGKDLHDQIVLKEINRKLYKDDKWILWSFTNPADKTDHNVSLWLHENFHSYQRQYKNNSKWIAEASANWAAWYVYKYPQRDIYRVTFDPQLPMQLHYAGYNRIYHWSILLCYITEFVSDPGFIGRLYYNLENGVTTIESLQRQLAFDGHNFQDIFLEFAARTTVWDYPDRSISDDFSAREQDAIDNFEEYEREDYNHKFANIMSFEGTNGEMTAIRDTLKPGVYGWNAYKIDSTIAATYTIRLKGTDVNPEGTRFRAMVVKGSGTNYQYNEMLIDSSAAYGETEAKFQIATDAGEELYLVVVSMPTKNLGNTDIRYDYTYSFEADTSGVNLSTFKNAEQAQTVSVNNGEIKVNPTITDGRLNIDMRAYQSGPVDVSVFNMSGEEVLKRTYHNTGRISLYLDGPSGMYLVKVRSANLNKVVKIIKQ